MKRWLSRYVSTPVIAACLTAALSPRHRVGSASEVPRREKPSTVPASTPAPAAAAAPAPASAPCFCSCPEPQDDPWEERRQGPAEDVEYLEEALHKATLTECREAEPAALGPGVENRPGSPETKGYISTFMIRQADMGIAEDKPNSR